MSAVTATAPVDVQDENWPPPRLTDLVIDGAERFPTWWVTDGNEVIGFSELADRASRLAGGLIEWGVRRGDHVAVWMDNAVTWLDVWFATVWVGALLVPLNTRFTLDDAAYVLSASDSRWLIKQGPRFDSQRLRRQSGIELRGVAATEPGPDETPLELLAASERVGSREEPGGIGMIQYTSGSTAFPKGAMLPSKSLIRNGWGLGRAWHLDESDRVLCANPLFHCGGSVFAFMAAATSGSAVRLMRRWDPDAAAEIIQREGVTVIPGIDAMVRDLVARAKTTQQRFPSLRLVSTAGNRDLFENVVEHLGADVSNVYGLTECSPNVCVGDLDDPQEVRLARIGRPQTGLGVDIRDPETGKPLPTGHVGEIVVRGWAVMDGYYKDPEATASTTTEDGCLRTGDLGTIDKDGYLTYEGRLKQMIKSGGENIAIAEVEDVLRRHPDVADVVVLPVPDARFGEVGYAFAALLPDRALAGGELIEYGKGVLAGFKVPKQVTILSELPRTGSGKVDRQRLQERAEHQVKTTGRAS